MIAGAVLLGGIVILCIWFLSPASVSPFVKILLTTLVLLVVPIWVLIRYYLQTRAASQPAATSATPVGEGRKPKRTQLPPPAGTYQELTRGAEEAVQWLRGTKLGDAKDKARAADAVYALPWISVAGLSGSGKTSLLLSSGLDFHTLPSQRASELNIIRPTANNEWRMTDVAILLDTSGRYQTEGEHKDEWAALLETIKRYRKARPLDGFVIVVSAAAALRWSVTEIEEQAKVLRARLDEAMQRTETRFPVYLVFTHLDAIEGFAEFFNSFDAEERAQVWGSTIPLAQSGNAQALFDGEFDHLYARLLRRRMVQLGTATSPEEQLRIFKFPGRFRRTRSRLGQFASALFRPNPFSENPLLRGFYFTNSSGVGAIGARRLNGSEYFTRNLFEGVLLPDKEIVAATQAGKARPHLRRNILLATAAALAALFFVGMIVSFFNNKALIAEADARVQQLTQVRRTTTGDANDSLAAGEELTAIEGVRQTLDELDEYERNSPPLSLRFGLYSGDKLNSSDSADPSLLRHLYFEAIDERYLKPVVARMEEDLRAFVSAPANSASGQTASLQPASGAQAQATEDDNLGRHYDLLKAYLMLSKPERVEPTFLANELRGYWRQVAPPGREEDALKQLAYFASQAHAEDAPHPDINTALVAKAQDKLVAYPIVNRIYKRLTADVNSQVKYPVSLATIPGARDGNILVSSYAVPGSFTREGYEAMTDKLESSAEDEFRRDDWVMQGSATTPANFDVKKDELANMYYRDYIAQWQRFVQEIEVKEYGTKEEAVRALRLLASSNSPLASVMREVARQTDFSGATDSGIFAWFKRLVAQRVGGGATAVEREFRPLHQFIANQDDASPAAEYRTKLKNVSDKLNAEVKPLAEVSKSLQAGNDTTGVRQSRQAIADLLDSKGFNQTPASDATARLLKRPLDNLNTLLVGTDFEQIEKTWQPLYAKAQAFEAGFPFADEGSDTSVAALAQFLNPQDGELTRFFQERLTPYFEADWSIKQEASDKFAPEFVAYLKNARRLRDALFADGGKQPKVEYQIALAPIKDALVRVEIDGSSVSLPEKSSGSFIFPGDKSGAKLTVTPLNGQDQIKQFAGEWGALRMFREGGGGDGKAAQSELQYQLGTPVRMLLQPKSGTIFNREIFALRAPKSLQKS